MYIQDETYTSEVLIFNIRGQRFKYFHCSPRRNISVAYVVVLIYALYQRKVVLHASLRLLIYKL